MKSITFTSTPGLYSTDASKIALAACKCPSPSAPDRISSFSRFMLFINNRLPGEIQLCINKTTGTPLGIWNGPSLHRHESVS